MFLVKEFRVGLTLLNKSNFISNKGLLSIFQDIAEMHSASIGLGITNIDTTGFSWAILAWKLHIINRPKYGENLTVKTWARDYTKLYCYRDFEVLNESGEVMAFCTSKWVLLDVHKGKISKIEDDFVAKYNPETKSVFNIVELDKLNEANEYTTSISYPVRKSDIDINNHMNNLCYLDIATEILPDNINDYNNLEIMYKKQIKLGNCVKVYLNTTNNINTICVKSNDDSTLHCIIKLWD